jgi:hypothetical protein
MLWRVERPLLNVLQHHSCVRKKILFERRLGAVEPLNYFQFHGYILPDLWLLIQRLFQQATSRRDRLQD